MKQKIFYSELAYVIGLLLLAFGTALTELGSFGVSMVVAPAYLLHLKISQFLPWFSFGIAEYSLQAFLLLIMMLVLKKAKITYLFSFVTVILYGFALDASIALVSVFPADVLWHRISIYVLGVLLCCVGIALLFKTYLPPEVYEMFVKEVSKKTKIKFPVFKTVYDCVSCILAIALSLLFFREFRGIGIGTIVCSFINGALIGAFSKLFDRFFTFRDLATARNYFEESEEPA